MEQFGCVQKLVLPLRQSYAFAQYYETQSAQAAFAMVNKANNSKSPTAKLENNDKYIGIENKAKEKKVKVNMMNSYELDDYEKSLSKIQTTSNTKLKFYISYVNKS